MVWFVTNYKIFTTINSLWVDDVLVCYTTKQGNVVSGDSNDRVLLWDLRQRSLRHSWQEHEGGLRSIQCDSCKIVSASWDKVP